MTKIILNRDSEDALDHMDYHGAFRVNKEPSTYFGPHWDGASLFPRGMYGRKGTIAIMAKALMRGLSDRGAARASGTKPKTCAKLRFALETQNGKPFLCPCGKRAGHKENCSFRFNNSPRIAKMLIGLEAGWNRKRLKMPQTDCP